MPYRHGVFVEEVTEGLRPLQTVETSIIGLVATADDADAATFPLNQAVLVTDLGTAIGVAGTTGTLAATLTDIYKQANALTVVVRVAEDADPDIQDTNVIGGDAAGFKTGLQALLSAETTLSVKPRILGAPGLDTVAVATELVSIAQKMGAMTYLYADGATTKEEAVTYRQTFSAREAMVIWPHFSTMNAVAVALGLRSKIDQTVGWHKTISNVGVNGATGLAADVSFALNSITHDAHYLNANDVTTIIQQEGFRFWGSRTCSDDPKFVFESATRAAQVISNTIAAGHLWAVDKGVSSNLASDIVETVNAKLRNMITQGRLIGAEVWYDPNSNPTTELEDGNLLLDYDFTPVPPLENLGFRQRITSRHFINFAA